jgi:hypothetical protein
MECSLYNSYQMLSVISQHHKRSGQRQSLLEQYMRSSQCTSILSSHRNDTNKGSGQTDAFTKADVEQQVFNRIWQVKSKYFLRSRKEELVRGVGVIMVEGWVSVKLDLVFIHRKSSEVVQGSAVLL